MLKSRPAAAALTLAVAAVALVPAVAWSAPACAWSLRMPCRHTTLPRRVARSTTFQALAHPSPLTC